MRQATTACAGTPAAVVSDPSAYSVDPHCGPYTAFGISNPGRHCSGSARFLTSVLPGLVAATNGQVDGFLLLDYPTTLAVGWSGPRHFAAHDASLSTLLRLRQTVGHASDIE